VEFTRALLAPDTLGKRPPTEVERLVGALVVTEIGAARAPKNLPVNSLSERSYGAEKARRTQTDEASEPSLTALRTELACLDRALSLKGEPLLAALH